MLSKFLSSGRSRVQNTDRRLSDERKRRQMRSRRLFALENLEGRIVLSTMFVDSAWATLPNDAPVQIDGVDATIGTDAFATIKAAIAKTGNDPDGDVIQVAEGTYTETLSITKPNVQILGAGSDRVFLDVTAGTSEFGITVTATASNVTLSGFHLTGSTASLRLNYGINAAGASGLQISDVIVETTKKSGINLNGATNFSIDNAKVSNTNGAGIFLTDVKDGALSNITTSGNAWTGIGFSTFGKSFDIGVERITISGNNQFGESATPNGGVMFEESRWDKDLGDYDRNNPKSITFSTNPADGADVTFNFGSADPALRYVLTGAQDDAWVIRHNFYATLADGLTAATEALPGHYTGEEVKLSPLAPTTGAPTLAGPSEIGRGSTYTLTLTAAAEAGVPTQWAIDWGNDEAPQIVSSAETSVSHVYMGAPGDYTISVTEIVAGVYTSRAAEISVSVLNAAPTVAITGAPDVPVNRNQSISLGSHAVDPNGDALTHAWTVTRDGVAFADGNEASFAFTPDLPGEYVVTLTVTDPYGDAASKTATIAVISAAPTVTITGAPDSVNQGQTITLGSNAADPDGDELTHAWIVTRDGVGVLTGNGTTLDFAPTVPGNYLVTLTVADPYGASATATHDISVLGVAPTVTITGAADSVNQGESVHLTSAVVNPAGGPLVHAWTVTRDGVVVHTSDGESLDFTPVIPGNYLVTLTVTDIDGDVGTANHAIGVANVAPDVVIAPLPGTTVMSGDVVNLAATATDPNPNAALAYAWTITRNGVFMGSANQATLQYIPLFSGVYEATLVVSDGEGGVTTRSIQFEVQSNIPPAAEQAVEAFQERLDAQLERQQQRIEMLAERFGETQPMVQRMINRLVQTQVRMQSLVARRMMLLQRIFSRRGFR